MRENANWPCTVYGLREPGGYVRYVGQTRWTLSNRLKRHLGDIPKGIDDRRTRWIKEVLDRGGTIEIFPIEMDAVWHEAEIRWIAHYRQVYPDLLNVYDGGAGFKPGVPRSEETKQRMAEAAKRKWEEPGYRERSVAAMKEAANTSESLKLRSDIVKASWQRESVRNARVEAIKSATASEEFRGKMRKYAIEQMADPALREHLRQVSSERTRTPAARSMAAEHARNGWNDPVKRAMRIENSRKARWGNKDQPEIPGL